MSFIMWQTLITFLVVGLAFIFIANKVYRMIRQLLDPSQDISCSGGCSCCTISNCDTRKKQ